MAGKGPEIMTFGLVSLVDFVKEQIEFYFSRVLIQFNLNADPHLFRMHLLTWHVWSKGSRFSRLDWGCRSESPRCT